MKLYRFKRIVSLTFLYFVVLLSLVFFWVEITSGDIMLEFLLFSLAIILFSFYLILYKNKWVVAPAKIIFFSLFFINLILSAQYYFEYTDIVFFLPALLPLILLYKNDLKNWFMFLKSKPFYIFKKAMELSKRDIVLIVLVVLIVLIPKIYTFVNFSYWSISLVSIIELLIIPFYLILKSSPLKSIIRVFIFVWCMLLLRDVAELLLSDGFFNVKYMNKPNELFDGVLIYINSLVFPIFAIFVIYSDNSRNVLNKNIKR
ncbi:MAG: hypothetical protein WC928_03045 [Patescibacteria group bacterium]|jgi:hypothetical protein